jgi:3-phenylpropionate/trans-cinnamate dioxygenase ferredoxin reductase subunit
VAERKVDFLLIGGGMAAAHCASELRKQGAKGSVLVVTREPEPPYERPPLSKEYLRGEASRSDAYVHEPSWYAENDVELLTGRNVLGIDVGARTAKVQKEGEIEFGKLLLGTGARVNILHHLEGAQLDGIHYLRAFKNADEIAEEAEDAERVVLIGGSYIACEVAASLAAKGTSCTCVMLEDVAMSRSFGEEAGRFFHGVLESHGVELIGGETVEAFLGEGRVSGVRTESGREVEGELVVVGAGVHPEVMLAERARIEVENGVVCDSRLESSVEGIFAAGDCCSYESVIHGRRLRVEHWDVAFQQGRYAARAMLGESEPYREVPYFFSDLADWASLEYVGPAQDWDEIVWRGDGPPFDGLDEGGAEFSAWYLKDGKVAGCLSVERSEDLAHARRLLSEGVDVSADRDKIADLDTDLEALGDSA